MYLRELNQSVQELKGVGRSIAASYAALGIFSWSDLLLHFPRTYEDRNVPVPLIEALAGKTVNSIVTVLGHQYIGRQHNRTLKVLIRDESAAASLLCFGRNFMHDMLKVGHRYYIYGQFSEKYHELQCSIFEVEPYHENRPPVKFGKILPIYPLAGKLSQNILRRDISWLLRQHVAKLQNELPEYILERQQLLPKPEALRRIHFPHSLEAAEEARLSLAYEEFFYLQLIVRRRALKRAGSGKAPGSQRAVRHTEESSLAGRLVTSLPFRLTPDQHTVLNEITDDIVSPRPMARLIQGDVGSGKTLTAFIAALQVIETGGQSAFMAPTELLARQHAENAALLLEPLGVRLAYLTGSVQRSQRDNILRALIDGDIDMIIGTHALFSRDVRFQNLRLVIVDEQHRFGVLQRLALVNKGELPDLLLMTATPIPRTLAMTVFGDLDVSVIRTMPPGRKPVITHLASETSRKRVYDAVRVEFDRGHQAYFVYPRIEETGKSELRDAESMYRYLTEEIYPGIPAGLIHSRIGEDEKLQIMDRFRSGELRYLVSTSVVEVGVDIPNATCMVIEHAERFGLSGLHQLRGRVGRSTLQSYAFLIYSGELSESGRERLKVMRESHDGFDIAEKDLQIRGPGEMAGIRQSGFLRFAAADLILDHELLLTARSDVDALLAEDPGLLSVTHQMLREVLQQCPPFAEELTES